MTNRTTTTAFSPAPAPAKAYTQQVIHSRLTPKGWRAHHVACSPKRRHIVVTSSPNVEKVTCKNRLSALNH